MTDVVRVLAVSDEVDELLRSDAGLDAPLVFVPVVGRDVFDVEPSGGA